MRSNDKWQTRFNLEAWGSINRTDCTRHMNSNPGHLCCSHGGKCIKQKQKICVKVSVRLLCVKTGAEICRPDELQQVHRQCSGPSWAKINFWLVEATVIDTWAAASKRHAREQCGAVQREISAEWFRFLKRQFARTSLLGNCVFGSGSSNHDNNCFTYITDVQGLFWGSSSVYNCLPWHWCFQSYYYSYYYVKKIIV